MKTNPNLGNIFFPFFFFLSLNTGPSQTVQDLRRRLSKPVGFGQNKRYISSETTSTHDIKGEIYPLKNKIYQGTRWRYLPSVGFRTAEIQNTHLQLNNHQGCSRVRSTWRVESGRVGPGMPGPNPGRHGPTREI